MLNMGSSHYSERCHDLVTYSSQEKLTRVKIKALHPQQTPFLPLLSSVLFQSQPAAFIVFHILPLVRQSISHRTYSMLKRYANSIHY